MGNKKQRKMNAARICFGISRIGYTPASAICDIVDNAVSAHAKNVHIKIIKKENNIHKKNNVVEYLIIDDGDGMDEKALENALDLGSKDFEYSTDTLSKFGLGLKSASFAQGKRLEVITGDGETVRKEYVDLEEIDEDYFSVEEELSDEDRKLVDKYFVDKKRGTIIRISKIHTNNHPSIKSTLEELKEKIGVIYYYFLENDLHIFLDNEEEIKAFDPLFINEAGNNNLDENEWDGKTVQWLLRPVEIMLDTDAKVNGKIEITMLPHPKVRKDEGISDANIRKTYHISASNYGFYVYRNRRLINWANRLDIIPQDQDFYAFRGRINIREDADDAFNIDVSKSHINLSEDAMETLDDYIADYRRKCKIAWKNAYNKYKANISEDSNDISNNITNDIETYLESIPDEDDNEFVEEYTRRDVEIEKQSRRKDIDDTISRINDEVGEIKKENQLTNEEINITMKGGEHVNELNKIFKVTSISDNMLWEPYVDAEKKQCVRISKSHRYAKLIYENNSDNKDLQVLFELFLYIEARAELEVRKQFHDVDMDKVTEILEDYRVAISEKLAKLCRKEEHNLPPYLGD